MHNCGNNTVIACVLHVLSVPPASSQPMADTLQKAVFTQPGTPTTFPAEFLTSILEAW